MELIEDWIISKSEDEVKGQDNKMSPAYIVTFTDENRLVESDLCYITII